MNKILTKIQQSVAFLSIIKVFEFFTDSKYIYKIYPEPDWLSISETVSIF